jgi:cytochrome c oxidase subunit 3/cytochrome o ubiquinol oxidase subunit 3
MVLALSAIQHRDMRRTRTWLLATAALGSVFVGGQIYEFSTFIREGMTLKTNVTASAFYTLTGFHGVHVTLGIVMLLSLFGLSLRGRLGPQHAEAVELVGLYWHFVDVIWILIFFLVYLIPGGGLAK